MKKDLTSLGSLHYNQNYGTKKQKNIPNIMDALSHSDSD